MPELTCPACTMPKPEWETAGGVVQDGITYCCRSCAEGTQVIELFELLEAWGREIRKVRHNRCDARVTVALRGWRWADPDAALAGQVRNARIGEPAMPSR